MNERISQYGILLLILQLLYFLATGDYGFTSIGVTIVVFLMVLAKIGTGIVLREVIAFFYALTCLFLPYLGYEVYNNQNYLAVLWGRYMPIDAVSYYNYALVAITSFCIILLWPIKYQGTNLDTGIGLNAIIAQIKKILQNPKMKALSFGMMILGVFVSFLVKFMPAGLQFFVYLIYFSSFAGLMYIWYAPNFKWKNTIMITFSLFVLAGAISSGMFTIVAYMGATMFSFFLLNRRLGLLPKVLFVLTAFILLIALQYTKKGLRNQTWSGNFQGSETALFFELYLANLEKGEGLVEKNTFFPFYSRANQGYNVGLVMRRFPNTVPHDEGSALSRSILSSFVPRFLWPDKPEAGGKFNMKYYTGLEIRGWSTNVGPLGEAYGAFGNIGGIFYMAFLAFFIRWVYRKVFVLSVTYPLLILWLPVLFYQTIYSAENDTLQIFNSLVKSSIFIYLTYRFVPTLFKKRIDLLSPKSNPKNNHQTFNQPSLA